MSGRTAAGLLLVVGVLLAPPAAGQWDIAASSPGPELRERHFEPSTGRYLGMIGAGTLGSAAGLIGGLLATGAVYVATSGCVDCADGIPAYGYALMGASSMVGTAIGVSAVADPPEALDFRAGLGEVVRSRGFRPALIGALVGVASGAALGSLVARVAPPDEPYALVAYNLGQSLASTVAVGVWAGRVSRPR